MNADLDAVLLLARCHRAYDLALRMTEERDHLRSLITAWAEAHDDLDNVRGGSWVVWETKNNAVKDAYFALRKAVGR